MHVIRATQDSALTALAIAQPFDRLVRARGFGDRRTLLDMLDEAIYLRDELDDTSKLLDNAADELANQFWRRFVVDHSSVPRVDLDKWRF
jgi:hypothetical protein